MKQIVVVVHGVGVREAGVSTDLVAAALDSPPRDAPPARLGQMKAGDSPGGRTWLPHSSDDFTLHELPGYAEGARLRSFGARLRRYRRYDDPERRVVRDERVVADFYWGDISGTGSDPLSVVIGFLRVLFGLSHAVRENLASAFPDPRGWHRMVRFAGALAVLAIHGPVFALNLVLLGGFGLVKAMVLLGTAWPALAGRLADEQWTGHPWLVGVAAVVAGAVMLRWLARVYLMRLLAAWIVLAGLLVLALTGMATLSGCLPGMTGGGACPGWLLPGAGGLPAHLAVGQQLMAVMVGFWGLALMAALAAGLACHLARPALRQRQVVPFALPAVGLMMLLWFVLVGILWAAVLTLTAGSVADRMVILQALAALPLAVITLVVLGLAALGVQLRKSRDLGQLAGDPARYMGDPDRLAEKHRLIVAPWMLGVLTLFPLAILAQGAGLIAPLCKAGAICNTLGGSAAQVAGLLPVLLALGTLAIGPVRRFLATGIDILTDVLVYLNDHSWESSETPLFGGTDPKGTGTTVFLERWLGLGPGAIARAAPKAGYWSRRRIDDRLRVLMAKLILTEVPDDIVVISHSQGTVIALDVIEAAGAGWRAAMPDQGRLRLVTMGSPYTHLYNRYFPRAFPPHRDRPKLRPAAEGGVLDRWVNIFRIDDFVGTHVDAPRNRAPEATAWPEEYPVPPGGHTNYWTDQQVVRLLRVMVERGA